MSPIKMNKYLFLLISLALCGCTANNGSSSRAELIEMMKQMKISEKASNERRSKELVAFMSLETMFPDRQVRALAKAAGRGRVKQVEELVSQGVDVNARGKKNATVLFWAMKKNSIKGFRKLLELGADPNAIFDDGGAVMHWAVRHKNPNYLKSALEYGGNPNLMAGSWFKQTPIYETISIFGEIGNTPPALSLLLDAGADVNAESSNGDFPIILAAYFGRFDIVHTLLQRGADYRIIDGSGDNLADIIASKRELMDPNHELYRWLEKVVTWLQEKGVAVQ